MESSPGLLPARAAAPVAPYLGGKRNLARRIIARLAEVPHGTYVEPFIGMGGVFLRRPYRAKAEVINDVSRDVTTLFRVLQRHYVPLMDMLRWQLTSRTEFERLAASDPDTLTDLERAARFLYLQRTAFGGRLRSQSFGVSPASSARFDISRLASMLEDVHERLAGVVIERLPYPELLVRYDRPETLFYLDPPYFGNERDYGDGVFGKADWERLPELLAKLTGRWLMSINDVPAIRRAFAAFEIEEVRTTYSIARRSAGDGSARELLISGPARSTP